MADNIQATPRNYFGGLLSDAYKYMQSPQRTQQMQGFAGLLGTTGVPQTIERMAYGEPLTNIGRANVPLLKPETADALMTVAPMVGPAARGAKMLPKNLPVGMSIKPVDDVVSLLTPKNSFTYPQEEAMRLAQQRAALPVEQGGLGLLSSNTPAERAKAMGFEKDAYHVTSKDFDAFNVDMSSPTAKWGKAVYSTENKSQLPLLESAVKKRDGVNGINIKPLLLKLDAPYESSLQGGPLGQMSAEKMMVRGFDSAIDGQQIAVFNPENIRSRFAAFDPFRKTAATAAAMGVAAPDLLAQEQPVITQQQIDDELAMYGLLGR